MIDTAQKRKIVLTSGLALFAMFFGAGNIIFPLALGAHASNHIFFVIIAFLISGIGLPFLGLFATSLHQGDYWKFFNKLGKIPSFLLITFLILIIGPFFAIPRTEAVTFHTLQPFLPGFINNPYIFSGLYCATLFLLTYRDTKIVDIIGKILSPIKISLFIILILAGLFETHHVLEKKDTILSSVKMGLINGYSTMDLLATFFFCAVVSKDILNKIQKSGITCKKTIFQLFLSSCLVSGVILSLIYVGFMLVALYHSAELQSIETAQLIVTISNLVLGKFGAIFVGVCVAFACLVTAIALTEVTTSFFHEKLARKKISRLTCLIITILTIYAMTIMDFSGLMKILLPILEYLYPALIVYCIINIFVTLSKNNLNELSLNRE